MIIGKKETASPGESNRWERALKVVGFQALTRSDVGEFYRVRIAQGPE